MCALFTCLSLSLSLSLSDFRYNSSYNISLVSIPRQDKKFTFGVIAYFLPLASLLFADYHSDSSPAAVRTKFGNSCLASKDTDAFQRPLTLNQRVKSGSAAVDKLTRHNGKYRRGNYKRFTRKSSPAAIVIREKKSPGGFEGSPADEREDDRIRESEISRALPGHPEEAGGRRRRGRR